MTAELFANTPSTTVSSGGTDAPVSGTVETWTVASSASFPAASSIASPPTQFHVGDPAADKTGEMIAVTDVSGTTWTVTRGAESTTPVAHSTGFTVQQVVTAGGLGMFAQTGLGDLGGTGDNPEVTSTHLGTALSITQGGTGAGTQQGAITSLTGTQGAGKYLRSDGTNASLSVILAADVPTLNQNTTGTASAAGNVTGTVAIVNGGTGQGTQQGAINSLAGAVTAGQYLRGNGTNVSMSVIHAADVPTLNQNTTGTAGSLSSTLVIGEGGTGQTTQQAALNALAGTQAAGYVLGSNGTNTGFVPDGGVIVKVPAPTGATATDTPNVTGAITTLTTALASGPATLLFQDGTYQVDSNELVVQSVSNFTVRGSGGTVITQAPNRTALPNNTGGDLLIIADSTNFRVQDITIDGLRDTVSPLTPLTASASSGQPSVTVASGSGARYVAGQTLSVFGGLGTADTNEEDLNLTIQSISAGGGSGGGDLITFTTNLSNSYTHLSSTALSDGFGPYAYAGAYLTNYQTGSATVAGRTLSGEDQQNGLHLLNCQRFVVDKVTSRNLWESPVKCGTGFSSTVLTDGCSLGAISDCTGYHAYDQGISLWFSSQISVEACLMNAAGWSGVSMSGSDNCAILGNQITGSVYRVPNDNSSGSGICIEGGAQNQVKANIITAPYGDGMRIWNSPVGFGQSGSTAPTTSTYLTAQTAAGTSVQVSSTTHLVQGGIYSLIDGSRTESVTIASIVDGSHVTFTAALQFSHASGTYISNRISQENVIEGNTITGPVTGYGILNQLAVRSIIKNNLVHSWGLSSSNRFGITLSYGNTGAANLPSGVYLAGNSSVVQGNVVGGGCAESVLCDSTDGLSVTANRFYGSTLGSGMGLHVKGCVNCDFSDNVISDVEANSGIYVENGGQSSTVTARCTFSGNVVTRTSNEGMIFLVGDSLTITGNTASGCGGDAGINLRGVTNSVIADNICNSNSHAGIQLENQSGNYCLYNRVTGNTCRDDGSGYNITTGVGWTQQYGILESGNSNNNLFTGNECDSNGTGQITTAGAASYAWANIISGAAVSGTSPVIVSGQYLRTPTSYAPAGGSPTVLTCTSGTLSAFSSSNVNTGSWIAPPSGDVVVTVSAVLSQATASHSWALGLAPHGSISPVMGNLVVGQFQSATLYQPTTYVFPVTGLSAGGTYNFDLLGAIGAGGTSVQVNAWGQSGTAPTLSANTTGAPVVMSVQAV